jgi:hypothetical protein
MQVSGIETDKLHHINFDDQFGVGNKFISAASGL